MTIQRLNPDDFKQELEQVNQDVDQKRELEQRIFSYMFMVDNDKITHYLICLIFLFFFALSPGFRDLILGSRPIFLSGGDVPFVNIFRLIFFMILPAVASVFATYYIIADTKRSKLARFFMALFASGLIMLITWAGFAAYVTGSAPYLRPDAKRTFNAAVVYVGSWLMFWNAVRSIGTFLLSFYQLGKDDADYSKANSRNSITKLADAKIAIPIVLLISAGLLCIVAIFLFAVNLAWPLALTYTLTFALSWRGIRNKLMPQVKKL